MLRKQKHKRKKRRGIATVEAAVCLPLLIIIWLGTFEVTRRRSLQQQAQLLASNAAHRILDSEEDFQTIEGDTLILADSLGIEGCQVQIVRIDEDLVETTVSMDFSQNSPINSILSGQQVTSIYSSYRRQ